MEYLHRCGLISLGRPPLRPVSHSRSNVIGTTECR
jgi:hypothetical protein